MNCCKCGEEIAFASGYVCRECLEAEMKQLAINDIKAEENSGKELSPREAIIAMLDGNIVRNIHGYRYRWDDVSFCFTIVSGSHSINSFAGLYLDPDKKTRPMTAFECLAWVNSPDSQGWMVSTRRSGEKEWGEWDIPQRFKYDGKERYYDMGEVSFLSYRRAKILPDKSGIDESIIQGFLVEAE